MPRASYLKVCHIMNVLVHGDAGFSLDHLNALSFTSFISFVIDFHSDTVVALAVAKNKLFSFKPLYFNVKLYRCLVQHLCSAHL